MSKIIEKIKLTVAVILDTNKIVKNAFSEMSQKIKDIWKNQ